jgi:hypothetical protein
MTESDNNTIFIVEEEKPDHHFRTEIPNIVFDLGLSVYALAVYAKLKKIAGDGGYCSYGIPRLAEDLKISEKKVRESKKELSKPFKLLNNLPLIKVTKRKSKKRVNQTDVVTICAVWRINGDFYRGNKKSSTGAQQEPGGGSPQEPGGSPQEPGGSPQEPKEEPFKEKPFEEEPSTATKGSPKKTPPSPKQKPSSSSKTFCLKKDEVLKHLPLTNQTKYNLQEFSLEILTYAAAKKLPKNMDSLDGYFFALCMRLDNGSQSMEDTPSSSEAIADNVKSNLQDMFKEVEFPPGHKIDFLPGGYNLVVDGEPRVTIGYGEEDCIGKTEKIITHLKEQNDKR